MRFSILFICILFFVQGYAQTPGKIKIAGVVLNQDSVPIQGVAVINVKNGKTSRTDKKGYFEAEFSIKDSLLIYHISFKKQFVNSSENRKRFVLEPEVHELMQVDILDKNKKQQEYLDSTMISVKELAPKEKLTGYDKKSTLEYYIEENGSHTKGFSPYFGPSFSLNFGKSTNKVIQREHDRQLKELTAHYHLVHEQK